MLVLEYSRYQFEDSFEVIALWNECYDSEFPMDDRLWTQNVHNCDFTSRDGCWVVRDEGSVVGAVIAKVPGNINSVFVHPRARCRGIGRELLSRAEAALTESSGGKLIAGQDYGHFFPGIPDSSPSGIAFFKALGWKVGGPCYDLYCDLRLWTMNKSTSTRIKELRDQGFELRGATTKDIPSLRSHIEQNFSPRWLAETLDRVSREPDPSEIKIAVRDGVVVGFCQTFTTVSVKIGPSIMWRGLLGPHYGGLGPIGVGADVRKIGLGLAIVEYSIAQVKAAGAYHMAIDWTGIVDFYGKAKFKVWKTYLQTRSE